MQSANHRYTVTYLHVCRPIIARRASLSPGSTNSWQTTIEAAAEQDMMDPEQISGLVHIETSFLDGDKLINKSVVRIFYV